MELIISGQPQRLVDPGLEVEMPAQNAAAEGAGHQDAVAGLGSAADQRRFRVGHAQQRDGDCQRSVPTVRVAAGNRHAVLLGQRQQPCVQFLSDPQSILPGQGQRDHRRHGPGGHRRQIAQVDRQRLAPYAAR